MTSLPARVAIISPVSPYPTDAGKKVMLAGLVEYWASRLGADNVHYVLIGRPGPEMQAVPARLHVLDRPAVLEQMRSLVARTVLTGRRSIQESMLYSSRLRDELAALLQQVDADLEVFDTIRMGQYAGEIDGAGRRRVVYLDDLFSVRYARMLETMRRFPDAPIDALGEFRAVVPRPLARLIAVRSVQRAVLHVERRLVARRELDMVDEFSRCLLVSPAEVGALQQRSDPARVAVLPPVVPGADVTRSPAERPVFVLLGLLSLPHNHDATMAFLKLCMPDVARLLPDAEVHIVGRGARPELVAAAADFPGQVRVEGYVHDLGGLLSRATAVVAPLRFGSGIKIKVIEALAHGVPVLTTPVGAEGITTGPRAGVLVEEAIERLPERMAELADPEWNAALSTAARLHHRQVYSRPAAYAWYDQVFDLSAPLRPAPGPVDAPAASRRAGR